MGFNIGNGTILFATIVVYLAFVLAITFTYLIGYGEVGNYTDTEMIESKYFAYGMTGGALSVLAITGLTALCVKFI